MRAPAAVFVIASFSSNLFAAEPPKAPDSIAVVALAADGVPGPELKAFAAELRRQVATLAPATLSSDEVRRRIDAPVASASLSELDRDYAVAITTLNSGNAARAAEQLTALAEKLEAQPPSAAVFGRWSHTQMRLARAQGASSRRGPSTETLRRLLQADLSVVADPDVYPPSFVQQLEETRQALESRPRRAVTIQAPRGARIFVFGREVGLAPVHLALGPGTYPIFGLLEGHRTAPVRMEVSDRDASVRLPVLPIAAFRSGDVPALHVAVEDVVPHVVTVGALLKTTVVVATERVTDGGLTYHVATSYDVARGVALRRARISASPTVRLAEQGRVLARYLINGEDTTCDPAHSPQWAAASASEKKRLIADCAGVAVAVVR